MGLVRLGHAYGVIAQEVRRRVFFPLTDFPSCSMS